MLNNNKIITYVPGTELKYFTLIGPYSLIICTIMVP